MNCDKLYFYVCENPSNVSERFTLSIEKNQGELKLVGSSEFEIFVRKLGFKPKK